MKREELKNLGLSDEQIDKVMALNGQDIENFKSKAESLETERDSFKSQVEEANKTIGDLKKNNKDIEDIQNKATEWENKYNEAEEARVKAVRDGLLNTKLAGVNAHDVEMLKGQLNMDTLKFTDDNIEGLDEQLKSLKESKGFLFKDESNSETRFSAHTPPGSGGENVSEMEATINSIFED